jgi:regulator of protease activity HflC (stomatin/prohibitin superfamily)
MRIFGSCQRFVYGSKVMTSVLVIVLVLIAAALVALLAVKTVRIIPQARAANVERFGRYRRTLVAGLNFVVPVLDRVKPLIDLRGNPDKEGKLGAGAPPKAA